MFSHMCIGCWLWVGFAGWKCRQYQQIEEIQFNSSGQALQGTLCVYVCVCMCACVCALA